MQSPTAHRLLVRRGLNGLRAEDFVAHASTLGCRQNRFVRHRSERAFFAVLGSLNGRDWWLISRNLGRVENYAALVRSVRAYRRPFDVMTRYLLGTGTYPCDVAIRTAAGVVEVTAYNSHDVVTVHEVFGRLDYACSDDVRVVVDIGSNIGVSALYFLTRNRSSHCVLYEPDPRNLEKLRSTLARFADRIEVHESAVADRQGYLPFAIEPYGRYGGLDKSGESSITVRVEHINDVLERALATHDVIDVLKIDTEGTELATLRAARPELLKRVRRIYYESFDPPIALPGFASDESCDTVRLDNLTLPALR